MKKEIIGILFLLILVGFVAAAIEYPKVYIKVEADKKALIRFVDPSTGDQYEDVPLMTDHSGVSVADLKVIGSEVSILVFLKDRETGEIGNPREVGPFDTDKDVYLDYRSGVLRIISEEQEEASAEVESESPEIVPETTETVVPTTPESLSSGVTGNVISNMDDSNWKNYLWIVIIAAILIAVVLFITHQREKTMMEKFPESKELHRMEKEAKIKGKAIGKIKVEQKVKAKLTKKEQKMAKKLAIENAEIGELNREGADTRKKEIERFDAVTEDEEKELY